MEPKVIQLLREVKGSLENYKIHLRPGSLGYAKNEDLIKRLTELIPPTELPKHFDAEMVYPKK